MLTSTSSVAKGPLRNHGASLLIMIGVLAVVAMFSVVFLREMLRETDHEVARQEVGDLKSFGEALQRAIMKNSYIPDQGNWANMVAAETGASLQGIASNRRSQPRILLIDTNGWLQDAILPYPQTNNVLPVTRPANPRMMIVSSLGAQLPISSGYPLASEFAQLWNCRDGEVPGSGSWSGWAGRPRDVRVERVTLDGMFVRVLLMTSAKESYLGRYSLDGGITVWTAPQTQPSTVYYVLQGTTILLYSQASGSNLDLRQILTKDASFKYEDGIWKTVPAGGSNTGLDLAGVARGFLACTPNTNAVYGAAQQAMIMQSFISFMSSYITWATNGFPAGGKTAVQNQYSNMWLRSQQIYQTSAKDDSGNNGNRFPINQGSCD